MRCYFSSKNISYYNFLILYGRNSCFNCNFSSLLRLFVMLQFLILNIISWSKIHVLCIFSVMTLLIGCQKGVQLVESWILVCLQWWFDWSFALEMCMGMWFPMGSGIPWESHGNGNKTELEMGSSLGMGITCTSMEIYSRRFYAAMS